MHNYYPDFNPEKEGYVDYAKEKNRDFLIHDHCTLTLGIKPEVARDKYPEST